MGDNINFATIALDWLVPGAFLEIDHNRATTGLPIFSHKMLVTGQRIDSVLGATLAPSGKPVRITRNEQAVQYFGRGAMITQQIEAILAVNPYTELWAIALDDNPAGQAAEGQIIFSGSPTESGTAYLRIGGRDLATAVVTTQSPTEIAAAVAATINNDLDGAVIASSTAGAVTVTSRHKGLEGNNIDIRFNYFQGEAFPEGLAVNIIEMSGGTANPNVTDLITGMADLPAYSILSGWTDAANMQLLEAELTKRWGGMEMRQGHVFGHVDGTFSELAAYGSSRNSAHSTVSGLNNSPSLPWVIAAQFGAAVEFSGANDPAVPFKSIYLPNVMAPEAGDQFLDTERNLLLHDGISTMTFDASGQCFIEQVITTYQTNTFGVEDRSLLKLNTKWTVDYMRYAFRYDILNDYPKHKLADDSVLDRISAGQDIATPKLIRNTLIATARKLEKAGLLENLEQFIADVKVVRSDADRNRVNAIIPPDTVNQFDVFAAAVQYIL